MSQTPACFIHPDALADLPNTQSALVFADSGPHAGLVQLCGPAALADAVAKECARWESAIGAVMPADFKDWHENDTAERPAIAAWCIANLRESEAAAWAAVDALKAKPSRWECREIGGAGMWTSEASEEDARATAARWSADGYQAEVVPLFEIPAKAGGQS